MKSVALAFPTLDFYQTSLSVLTEHLRAVLKEYTVNGSGSIPILLGPGGWEAGIGWPTVATIRPNNKADENTVRANEAEIIARVLALIAPTTTTTTTTTKTTTTTDTTTSSSTLSTTSAHYAPCELFPDVFIVVDLHGTPEEVSSRISFATTFIELLRLFISPDNMRVAVVAVRGAQATVLHDLASAVQ